MSLDELGVLVAHVSGLRATEKIRARQLGIEETRREEVPRQSVWTLGSGLCSLRIPKESTATASSRTLKLIAIGGKLIRCCLRGAEDAEPLISAFAQGVVLGFYRLAKSDIPGELEGVGFWRHCELAIIHHAGVDGGERIRAEDDRNRSRWFARRYTPVAPARDPLHRKQASRTSSASADSASGAAPLPPR
jgi:hypothetical protein